MIKNPFGVLSPEQLDADYIAENFVDIFTDVPRLRDPCNTFISGARGTGKSMLLRSLEPEVLIKTGKAASIASLPYLSVHIPLRKAEFGVTELRRVGGYASVAIGEHLLSMHVMYRFAALLHRLGAEIEGADATSFLAQFVRYFELGGGSAQFSSDKNSTACDTFAEVRRVCEEELIRVRQYYTRLPLSGEVPPYKGALVGFLDFLIPLMTAVSGFKVFNGIPIYLMLDDADNLPISLQKVLNSWVSTRSTHVVCLKVTAQLGYGTYRTVDNRLIESPHDFSEVNISTLYTNEHNTYHNQIREIVARRFKLHNIEISPEVFFPRDETQHIRLQEIQSDLEAEHRQRQSEEGARGASRARDDVTRYAVPRLMRELAGASRSSHTYSYAGFKSLVDLSSGVVRWFLEPASRMYDRVVSEKGEPVSEIPVATQDKVINDWASEFIQKLSAVKIEPLEDRLEEPEPSEESLHAIGHETILYERLRNLLDGLGLFFRHRLLDEKASEQRVFSVVLRDRPSNGLRDVLELGVRLGYLQKADNAAKEAIGLRLPRYILARRLGPHYRLDVSGYAAHVSVMSRDLELAIQSPVEFVRRKAKSERSATNQLTLELGESAND